MLTHQSSSTADLRVGPAAVLGRLRPYTMADFAFGMEWGKFTGEIFVENAFDKRAELTRYQQCGQCNLRVYIVPYRPRTLGHQGGDEVLICLPMARPWGGGPCEAWWRGKWRRPMPSRALSTRIPPTCGP